MTKRLDALRQQYEKQPDLASLIEYLEQAYKENECRTIIDTAGSWQGGSTPELDFYVGAALLTLGRKAEAIQRFQAVLAVNPNHFRAKKKLEEADSAEVAPDGAAAPKELRQIRLPDMPSQESDHYQRIGRRNIMIAVGAVIALILLAVILAGESTSGVEKLTADPEATLWPLTYTDFERRSEELRRVEEQFSTEDAPRKALFYLSAFTALDYTMLDRKEIVTQARFYFTLTVEKDETMVGLMNYIDGRDPSSPLAKGHRLAAGWPGNKKELATYTPQPRDTVTGAGLRAAWYDALLLYRGEKYDESLKLTGAILAEFPMVELAQKLRVAAIARKAQKQDAGADSTRLLSEEQIRTFTETLSRWRVDSEERALLSEAYIALGQAAQRPELEREGFYLGCPGRYFCNDTLLSFMDNGRTEEAKRMALYVKEMKGNARDASDLRMVMRAAHRDRDYGNCYFAFKELQQFFPDSVDRAMMIDAAECCEKENYLEEALELYEKTLDGDTDPARAAKIAEMRYLLRHDPQSAQELKALADKNPESAPVLNSYLTVLLKAGNQSETSPVLDRVYKFTEPAKRLAIIERYLQAGLVTRAIELLIDNRDRREMRERLYDLYNHYFLFDAADAVAGKEEFATTAFWRLVRTEYDRLTADTAAEVGEKLEKLESDRQLKCFSPLLYLKAEAFRRAGNTNKTFAMIDGMLECDRNYLPGLIFAAEISYYQGDTKRAIAGVKYLLERERYLSPGTFMYHNYLTLLLAELYIGSGNEIKGLNFLTANLDRSLPFGKREREKLQDIYDKSKIVLKKRIEKLIDERFR
ncbi:MAG TPA: hypothetical protein PLV42_04875 [bacterium]|nr:hypothetical protein [bacterium]